METYKELQDKYGRSVVVPADSIFGSPILMSANSGYARWIAGLIILYTLGKTMMLMELFYWLLRRRPHQKQLRISLVGLGLSKWLSALRRMAGLIRFMSGDLTRGVNYGSKNFS